MSFAKNSKLQRLVPLLLDWFAHHARDLPWRRTRDPYGIWVSEIMLQQTQVKTVIPFWERWMRELPTIRSLAEASSEKIHKLWEGLGYYTRVRHLQKAAQQLIAQQDALPLPCRKPGNEAQIKKELKTPYIVPCEFPENFDDMLALPGIGRYTAGAICSIAFNQPTPILDGNVMRVLTRIFGIATNPREKQTNARLWQLAEELVKAAAEQESSAHDERRPKFPSLLGERAGVRAVVQNKIQNACSRLNQSLMELGALICTPRSPQCQSCPVRKLCIAWQQNLQEQLPNLGKRAVATERRFVAFIVERRGKFLVRQRPAGVVNAHLWEFPNVEVFADTRRDELHESLTRPGLGTRVTRPSEVLAGRDAPSQDDFQLVSTKPFCVIKHSITRYRITLEVYRAGAPVSDPARNGSPASNAPGRRPALRGRWLKLSELKKLSFPSAHKKILTALETPSVALKQTQSESLRLAHPNRASARQ